MAELKGLTAAEVAERVRLGQVNRTPRSHWRESGQVVARNLLTWFNAMVTPAAIALFVLGEYQGALAVSGMAITNTAISLFQEIRAKRHLDKLAILTATRARVLRDGQSQTIAADDVVLGEHILLTSGEPVVADGPVLEANFLEVDEALLTGESDPVRRQPGEPLLSGSYCVAGDGTYRADKVGTQAFAQATSAEARRLQVASSPLTRIVNRLVQILSFVALGLIALYTIAYVIQGFPKTRQEERTFVRMVAATITSMVPQGMVLTATIGFTLGAIVMSRRGAVVQRISAVETMAAVDVICTDKTGTLTTNRLKLEEVNLLVEAAQEQDVRDKLRRFASASVDRQNKNLQAIRTGLGDIQVKAEEQIPFKSQHRYSALRLGEQVLVLGAPEALRSRVELWQKQNKRKALAQLDEMLPARQQQGLRMLLLTEAAATVDLAGQTVLPDIPLRPLALVCLSDELRPDAGQVLEALAAQGIAFKVISGDHPETVRGTVSHLNLPLAHEPVVTGDELAKAANKAELIESCGVFGRTAPHQKVEIVQALRDAGHCVAMIGDGVNDVLPIKQADLGIAMGEGSQAAKTVAGLVLETNNFALLPETLAEGRTIVRNLRRSAKLFLVKNVYSFILILAYFSGWFGLHFPYVPQQVTLLNWLVIGLPALVIAFSRERSTVATKGRFFMEVGWFALRTGILFGLGGLAIMLIARGLSPDPTPGEPLEAYRRALASYQRTMLLSVLILLGITALFRALTDGEGETLRGDRRFRLLGGFAIPVYLLAMYWPFAARFFELKPLGPVDWGYVLLVAGVTYVLTLFSDDWQLRAARPSPLAPSQGRGVGGEGLP